MMLHATAPDGTTVSVDAAECILPEEMCLAMTEPEPLIAYLCTLRDGHPGPWHVADTGSEIAAVWAVEP